ncbi:MAG: hypothetical protein BJ554DRAFT_7497 [Olpidium bornovanus]|uniref:Uncharacterized protein n=1 Tax=Olpidium bornovanus TaxID=278681 RepID=A0A8H7ZVY8_9FUNG|nr:MAG: hypothetical protein BJ554DRAFT_7497 [Olpidium bornovanus]
MPMSYLPAGGGCVVHNSGNGSAENRMPVGSKKNKRCTAGFMAEPNRTLQVRTSATPQTTANPASPGAGAWVPGEQIAATKLLAAWTVGRAHGFQSSDQRPRRARGPAGRRRRRPSARLPAAAAAAALRGVQQGGVGIPVPRLRPPLVFRRLREEAQRGRGLFGGAVQDALRAAEGLPVQRPDERLRGLAPGVLSVGWYECPFGRPDYSFLEDVARCVDNAARENSKHLPLRNPANARRSRGSRKKRPINARPRAERM